MNAETVLELMIRNPWVFVHRKKRKNKRTKKNWNAIIDRAIYFAGIAGPVMTIPQVLDIWVLKTASGVSFISWFSYWILAFIWLLYGIAHKDKPITLNSTLWLIMDALILLGIIIYQ